ncbi:hypothetical protein DsansV1_C40g0237101 [Dioscorea sansibarensis]
MLTLILLLFVPLLLSLLHLLLIFFFFFFFFASSKLFQFHDCRIFRDLLQPGSCFLFFGWNLDIRSFVG